MMSVKQKIMRRNIFEDDNGEGRGSTKGRRERISRERKGNQERGGKEDE